MNLKNVFLSLVLPFASPSLVNAQVDFMALSTMQCPEGQSNFFLGRKDPAILQAERGKFLNEAWKVPLETGAAKTVTIIPIGNMQTMARAKRIGWQVIPGTQPAQVQGIGVAHNWIKDYRKPGDGMIQANEGMKIHFGDYIISDLVVGVQFLHILEDFAERGQWIAYRDGEIVKEGTFTAESEVDTNAEGEMAFNINVVAGFDEIIFTVDSSAIDTEYLLEYIDGCFYKDSAPDVGLVCSGPTARFQGDPHITTFDDVKYDCQGRGEYTVTKGEDYNVQGRFMAGKAGSPISVTKSIVFKIKDTPKVQIDVPEAVDAATCDYTFYVNDTLHDLETLGTGTDSLTSVFNHKAVIFRENYIGSRIEVIVKHSKVNGCVLAFQICLKNGVTNDVVGLLGTPDYKRKNDWMMPDGTKVTIPTTEAGLRFETAYNYCQSWCLGNSGEASMFKYTGNTNTAYYNSECGAAYDNSLEGAMSGVTAEVLDMCEDDYACKIDGVVGGAGDAELYLQAEEELDEYKLTPPAHPASVRRSSASGDPHIRTWSGELFDFHGVCDLVLLKNPDFREGLGMDINVRTKQYRQWSYISSAAIRIGDETFEVSGHRDDKGNTVWMNYFPSADIELSTGQETTLQYTISGYPIKVMQVSSTKREFTIDLGLNQWIVIMTWKDFVRVDIRDAKAVDFENSLGLMGAYTTGAKVARDRTTIMNDDNPNDFGMEWQVLVSEPNLFHDKDGPQAPEQCILPTATDMRRRLRDSLITQQDAEIACSRVNDLDREMCIFDVMATNDLAVVGAY